MNRRQYPPGGEPKKRSRESSSRNESKAKASADEKTDEQLTEQRADDDHGQAPKQHLAKQSFRISTTRQAGNAQRTDGRQRRYVDNRGAHVDAERHFERIPAAEL